MKSLHEVVVRNRLEQLRKRQRDEALQAQEELLAGVVKTKTKGWGGDIRVEAMPEIETSNPVSNEEQEDYDRSMSPSLLDFKKLSYEDRQLTVVKPEDDLKSLVGFRSPQLF